MKQDTSAKPVEGAPEVTSQAEDVSTDKASEESPAEEAVSAVEEKSESPPASEEAPPAVVVEDSADETPAAVEESNDENASEEVVEETPDEIKVCSITLPIHRKKEAYFMCFALCVLSAHLMVSFLFSLRQLLLISVSRQLTKQGIVSHVTLNITGENTVFLL